MSGDFAYVMTLRGSSIVLGLILFGGSSKVALAQDDGFGGDETGEVSETGPELSVRSGYGVASGKSPRRWTLDERLAGALPIGFELGYRAHPRWFIGGYGEYALGILSRTAETRCGRECTYTWLHLSLMVQYRILTSPSAHTWVGLGTGRHWFNVALDSEAERTQTFTGPEYVNLQFGADWIPTEGIALGPYSALSLGEFTSGVERCGEPLLCPQERRDLGAGTRGIHAWFSSGLRVTFLP